jgi:hypothetical protein
MRTLLENKDKADGARIGARSHVAPGWTSLAGWIGVTALVAGACAGCGPDDPDSPPEPIESTVCLSEAAPASGRPTVVLGRDSGAGFIPLQPGADLKLNYGPQGGQHVYVSIKLFAPGAAPWEIAFDFVEDVSASSMGSSLAVVDSCAGGWTAATNRTVFMNSSDALSGVMKVDATTEGLAAEAELPVTISP